MTHTQILRLVTRLNVGGPARHVLLLAKELQSEFPAVLAAGVPPPEEGELTNPEVPIHRVPLVRPIRPHSDLGALSAVRRLLRRTNPRILETHMAKAGTVGRLAAMSASSTPRTIHTFHGHVLSEYFSPSVQRAFIAIERFLARRTDVLVAVSDEVKNELLDLGIGQESQFVVLPLGIDLRPFVELGHRSGTLRSRMGLSGTVPLVGILGRLTEIKDHKTLITAVSRLSDAHLAVLGDGALREELREFSRSLGVQDRVHILGWQEDVPGAMADLDVVALTSLNEGTPLALIEALASARPVVATDVGGVRSVVEHGVSGFLTSPRDPEGITSCLRKLLGDPQLRDQMGSAGRASAISKFDQSVMLGRAGELYRDLLAG